MAVVVCPKCGIIVPASKGVCMRCGAPLNQSASAVVEPIKPEPKKPEPVAPVDRECRSVREDADWRDSRHASEPNPYVSLGWTIGVFILCWPLGIASLILRILSTRAWKAGKEESAKKLGKMSNGVAIAGIVLVVLTLLFY
ncbi:MAG: CD225/dispanin family protein [Alistipes sp.]|nr:CD225/dispanin family protein [Alistipes sp.]